MRWQRLQPLFRTLLRKAKYIDIYYSWQPLSPDPKDDFVIDCAFAANAVIVTYNIRDLQIAESVLQIPVLRPVEFVKHLMHG